MKLKKIKKDKRGVVGMLMFFIILILILIIGFMATIISSILKNASGEITPIMEDLGVVDVGNGNSVNFSNVGKITYGNIDKVINALPWIVGFSYVAALIFSVVFIISFRMNPSPLYVGLYLFLIILLIFVSIIMSNIYENIYGSDDVVASGLKENTLMSYMILHSPIILTIIAFLSGIYLFTKPPEETEYGI